MKCNEVIEQFPLYSYGEVSSEVEERIESHLAECADCRQALAKHRSFMEALDQREDPTEAALLTSCRIDFRRRLATEITTETTRATGGWLEKLRNLSQFHIPLRIPVGAMALVALGWLGARYTPESSAACGRV